MKEEYLKYNVEELAEDRAFIRWVKKGENDADWKALINSDTQFKVKAKQAREIIELLEDTYPDLQRKDLDAMWRNVEDLKRNYNFQQKTRKSYRAWSWAASILLIISLGVIGGYYMQQKNQGYDFAQQTAQEEKEGARLILADGNEVALNNERTEIEVKEDNQIIVDKSNRLKVKATETNVKEQPKMNELIIPYGKRSDVTLADGTKVWLNAGSKLAFPSQFNGKTRDVYLEGEACFKVAKNKAQPFIVHADELGIKVLGTYFDVVSYPEDNHIETVLIEGSVSVQKKTALGIASKEMVLKPYQKASYNKDDGDLVVKNEPEADLYVAWIDGWLEFSKNSLPLVLTKLERYYNVEFVLPAGYRSVDLITGKLDLKDSLEEVMMGLADLAEITYTIKGDKIYIH
ncbi:DUF4974 domain-containing protein [Puteibacter caeruleilacunae]|nr:DUF4974 domain-containing protein [Puteibacter caeruleilacunae]